MRDRIQVSSTQASATCTELPGRETELARREIMNTQGGIFPAVVLPVLLAVVFADEIAEYCVFVHDTLNSATGRTHNGSN
ncbi:MAG: hypothetical protein J4F39_02500 [Candidatus Latescibacteria bacterium]|nr:hypothetical protein [Candidatus Latescibacterota bacterium]